VKDDEKEETMKLYQKACLILAREGVSGLVQRAEQRAFRFTDTPVPVPIKENKNYERLVRAFHEKALEMRYGDLRRYYWYHTIDLGNGLITPGDFDYRASVAAFKFPSNMNGMTVLDVGSATGFFSFEFEKRGATVISVELPSIADWDMPPGPDKEITMKLMMDSHNVNSVEELHHYHLDGPFQFCREALNSKVKRCYSTIYDLSPQKLGVSGFDVIFVGAILLHTFSPLKALATLAPLCRGTMVISDQLLDEDIDQRPIMVYAGGETRALDGRTWWHLNRVFLEQVLKRLGFKNVSIAGHTSITKPDGRIHHDTIIHATKDAEMVRNSTDLLQRRSRNHAGTMC
jgi:tRNA (mo5U34)-methyltransferase